MNLYNRKELANKLNIGIETLRYYENIKIITTPHRDNNGYRKYSDDVLAEINFILKLKKLGFNLNEISNLLKSLKNEKDLNKDKLKQIISEKIKEIEEKITNLNELKKILIEIKESNILGECDTFKLLLKNK